MRVPRLALAVVLSLVLPPAGRALDPQAQEYFQAAISAMKENDLQGALENYRQAISTDPEVQALSDEGAGDWILAGLESQARSRSGDAQFMMDLGWMLQVKGEYKKALDQYRKAQGLGSAGQADFVNEQIRTLDSWVKASETSSSSNSSSSSGGGDSSDGGSDAYGSSPGSEESAPEPGPDPKDEEIGSLKRSLKGKDEQIEALQKEKTDLTKQIQDLQAENKKLMYWKARALTGGGGD